MLFVSSNMQFNVTFHCKSGCLCLTCMYKSTITVYHPTTSTSRSIAIEFCTFMSCELLQLTYRVGEVS